MKQQTEDLLTLIIRPTLNALDMGGEAAEALMIGTALVESGGHAIRQQGGPALGIWQVEPATHNDIWTSYLRYRWSPEPGGRRSMADRVLYASMMSEPSAEALAWNARYCCAIARVKYWRDPQPIPETVEGQAGYWKRIFNTELGAGTVEKYVRAWQNA